MTPNVLKLLTEYLNKAIKEKKAAEQKKTIEEKKPECDQSSKKAEEGMIFEMAKESDSDSDSDPASEKAEEAKVVEVKVLEVPNSDKPEKKMLTVKAKRSS